MEILVDQLEYYVLEQMGAGLEGSCTEIRSILHSLVCILQVPHHHQTHMHTRN